jgi:hypothetical protein
MYGENIIRFINFMIRYKSLINNLNINNMITSSRFSSKLNCIQRNYLTIHKKKNIEKDNLGKTHYLFYNK